MNATIYSKSPCPYCDQAKNLLKQKGVEYTEINAIENKDDLVKRVTEATGNPPMTVPQIWLGEQYIGGFRELAKYFAQNA